MTEYAANPSPAWEPTHPGRLLRHTVLPALNLSVAEAAQRLGVSRQALHNVTSERASISPEMAARLGKLCGNGPGLWLRMQQTRDLWRVEHELAEQLQAITTMHPAATPPRAAAE
jgi:addiction module HigA family antidote